MTLTSPAEATLEKGFMCILLLSRQHSAYDLILLSNRDEFFHRPTLPLSTWTVPSLDLENPAATPPSKDTTIIGGRDAARGGSWLVMSPLGRFAALTNFRSAQEEISVHSRGALPVSFITSTSDSKDFGIPDIEHYSGFSLLFGNLASLEDGVHLLSNRPKVTSATILTSQDWSCELSNTEFTTPWPKTILGRTLLSQCIEESLSSYSFESHDDSSGSSSSPSGEEELIDSLFEVLSTDSLPSHTLDALKESIFIPKVDLGHTLYGTRQQTVLLVRKGGHVKMIERTIEADGRLGELPRIVKSLDLPK